MAGYLQLLLDGEASTMTDRDALHAILLKLGELQTGVDRLREDFTDEKKSAAESRSSVHRRLDDQARDIAEIKTDMATTRQTVADISKHHDETVKPAVEDWKRMKTVGTGVIGVIALSGLSVGASLAWFSEASVSAIRHWLKIT